MAGKFGATILTRLSVLPSLFNTQSTPNSATTPATSSAIIPHSQPFFKNPSLAFSSLHLISTAIMAAQPEIQTEVVEPSPKIQKLQQQNGMDSTPLLKVKKLSDKAILPSRGTSLSAGYDLSSAIDIKVPARGKALVATDLSIAIPEGTYARIAPRSGLAVKHSIDVGAGVIDADYRGPVGVVLFNFSDVDFEVKAGDRIAQLILERILTPDVVEVEDLDCTVRGSGGFGSTGV